MSHSSNKLNGINGEREREREREREKERERESIERESIERRFYSNIGHCLAWNTTCMLFDETITICCTKSVDV